MDLHTWHFRRSIEAIHGYEDKVRIVLNKADQVDHQELMRVYGLSLARMKCAYVVLANGSVVTASERSERDLFWALRGGGSGSYGVVTQWKLASVPYVPRS